MLLSFGGAFPDVTNWQTVWAIGRNPAQGRYCGGPGVLGTFPAPSREPGSGSRCNNRRIAGARGGHCMDFIFNYIEETTYWSILFTVHALLAVALLGAITHQAASVLMPVRQAAGAPGFVTRFRAVQGAAYA